ncbi:hypothetical protein J2X36_003213 [Methylobacterium sp. BE186]|uniref:MBL fold metallo-hydrolase n=1 Tax=Methylobacterium sp. BE186 TaxID=2817715 RepID=UPI00285DEC38|nr:hypothetical protein [Methylobacterium sp. BE186]
MGEPASDQIEISVFGPGYGESSAVHLGSGQWLIIDSCIDSATKEPAALRYLTDIGVDVGNAVKMVIATHWHDDHIRGLSRVVQACASAKFCLAAAVTTKEFLETLESYNERHGIVAGSGTSEICATLKQVREDRRPAVRAIAERNLLQISAGELAHGAACEVWALSPSDAQFERSLRELGNLIPKEREAKRRAPEQGRNDLSVVAWVRVGEITLLLGADLEEPGDPDLGWSAILAQAARPQGRASVFKIPHHGSANGHHDRTWTDLLLSNPATVVTPWNRGRGLPTVADLKRIRSYSDAAFSTSQFRSAAGARRSAAVEKQIRETVGKLRSAQFPTGQVRLRNGGCANPDIWCVENFNGACHIDELLNSA